MTLLMLLFCVLLGVLMAWPCWLLLQRLLRARQPLICVQPYRPGLANASDVAVAPDARPARHPTEASDAATPPAGSPASR